MPLFRTLLLTLFIGMPNIALATDFDFMGIKNGMTMNEAIQILKERYDEININKGSLDNKYIIPPLKSFDFSHAVVDLEMPSFMLSSINALEMPSVLYLFIGDSGIFAIEVIYKSESPTPLPTYQEAFVNLYGGEAIGFTTKKAYHFLFVDKEKASEERARDVARKEDALKMKPLQSQTKHVKR